MQHLLQCPNLEEQCSQQDLMFQIRRLCDVPSRSQISNILYLCRCWTREKKAHTSCPLANSTLAIWKSEMKWLPLPPVTTTRILLPKPKLQMANINNQVTAEFQQLLRPVRQPIVWLIICYLTITKCSKTVRVAQPFETAPHRTFGENDGLITVLQLRCFYVDFFSLMCFLSIFNGYSALPATSSAECAMISVFVCFKISDFSCTCVFMS